MLATRPNEMSLPRVPHQQQQSCIHPWAGCLSGSCGLHHQTQGDPGGMSPTMKQVTGTHTLVPAMDPEEALELAPLGRSLVTQKSPALDNHPPTRKPLWKYTFPEKTFQDPVGEKKKKKYTFGHTGEGKEQPSFAHITTPSPPGSTAQGQVISLTKEKRACE